MNLIYFIKGFRQKHFTLIGTEKVREKVTYSNYSLSKSMIRNTTKNKYGRQSSNSPEAAIRGVL